MLAPAGYQQVIDSRAYEQAQLAVSRRAGVLRWRAAMGIVAAGSGIGSVLMLMQSAGSVHYIVTGIEGLLLTAAALAALFVWIPDAAKKQATKAYPLFDALQNPVEVTFTADNMTLTGERMTRRVYFSKTRLCIETPQRFVILTDENDTVILEKACFAEKDATEQFLRDVFARWIVKEAGV